MKSQTTAIWFVLAALLFAVIWFFEKHLQPAPRRKIFCCPACGWPT